VKNLNGTNLFVDGAGKTIVIKRGEMWQGTMPPTGALSIATNNGKKGECASLTWGPGMPIYMPGPYVQYLEPTHNIMQKEYNFASQATFAMTGIGETFEMELVRLSDNAIITGKKWTMDHFVYFDTTFCLFGDAPNGGCNGWPNDGSFQNGWYELKSSAQSFGSLNTNHRWIIVRNLGAQNVYDFKITPTTGKVGDVFQLAISRTSWNPKKVTYMVTIPTGMKYFYPGCYLGGCNYSVDLAPAQYASTDVYFMSVTALTTGTKTFQLRIIEESSDVAVGTIQTITVYP